MLFHAALLEVIHGCLEVIEDILVEHGLRLTYRLEVSLGKEWLIIVRSRTPDSYDLRIVEGAEEVSIAKVCVLLALLKGSASWHILHCIVTYVDAGIEEFPVLVEAMVVVHSVGTTGRRVTVAISRDVV